MFAVFRWSKLFLAKKTAAHHIIKSYQLFLIPISERTHCFSSLTHSKIRSSYTVSYLINTCGLSPESANSASKRVKFNNPQRPDSVLELLDKYGFNKTQISIVVRRSPAILSFDPEKTLLPKLEFFKSVGLSDIARVLSSNSFLLLANLENRLIPSYKFLKSIIGCEKKMAIIFERSSWAFSSATIVPNISLLKDFAVPSSRIELLLNHHPLSILRNPEIFRVVVHKVKEMGFDPCKSNFVLAVRVLSGKGSKKIWDRCSKVYKKWGWSEEDILSAFKKHPNCMVVSEKKIERTMGFLVYKFGCESKSVANFPVIFSYNLEKRIMPRCLVFQVLFSKGIIKKWSLCTILLPSDECFLERFVTRYEDLLPQLAKVYQGDADILGL